MALTKIHSLKLTASLPLNIGRLTPQKERDIFQPLIFRGDVMLVSGRVNGFHPTFLLALVWGSPLITGFSGPTLKLTQTRGTNFTAQIFWTCFSKKNRTKKRLQKPHISTLVLSSHTSWGFHGGLRILGSKLHRSPQFRWDWMSRAQV